MAIGVRLCLVVGSRAATDLGRVKMAPTMRMQLRMPTIIGEMLAIRIMLATIAAAVTHGAAAVEIKATQMGDEPVAQAAAAVVGAEYGRRVREFEMTLHSSDI